MMRTTISKPEAPAWYVVDAADQTLGRLATRVAHVLNGKHKVSRSRHQVWSDHVILVNAEKIVLTGKKSEQKEYIRHTGYLGHMRTTPFARLFQKAPEKVLAIAIRGMLPRNKLRKIKMEHLHIFKGPEHTHAAQQPKDLLTLFPKMKN